MERRAVIVRGTVQGVGFRPFIYGLASRHRLAGFVRNRLGAVEIEVEGEVSQLDEFLIAIRHEPPPLADISDLHYRPMPAWGERRFQIEVSRTHHAISENRIRVSPDVATCDACLAELFDPHDRRYKYPFINCVNCGPRLTIIKGAPYDRPLTTMADFSMCQRCQREYEDPTDRRFHAQPICCSACGPQLELCTTAGIPIATTDPLAAFARELSNGAIGALKGLGGYHLVCIADKSRAVAELRRRKHRDEKPMAIMIRDVVRAEQVCILNDDERTLLKSHRRPIVFLKKREVEPGLVCEQVAPGNPSLGVMLPYTPLHHLLMDVLDETPLVMTSGNCSDEPIAYLDNDATDRLAGIADVTLRHNRPIHVRCDDSVTRIVDQSESIVRRSRGYAPQPIGLPLPCEGPMLAVGGQAKGVFALGVDRTATVSHHMGDLDNFDAFRQFQRDISLYEDLFRIVPEVIIHDLHPDYVSTRYAQKRAAAAQLQTFAVQHHHAHMASCMVENGLDEPVIGVTFDGTGFGLDEFTNAPVVWGGEFLVGDYRQFRRAAYLRYVPMPGGEKAVREPWRMAAAHLAAAGCDLSLLAERIPIVNLRAIEKMLDRSLNSPMTSSAGRLFDAVASIAGLRDCVSYEGQAAMELEWLADGVSVDGEYPFELEIADDPAVPMVVDTRPIIRAAARDVRSGLGSHRIARRFHSTMVTMITQVCRHIADYSGLTAAVLSGGVFMNAIISTEVNQRLVRDGFRVYRHRTVPANDGGLSLGQLAVAARSLSRATCTLPARSAIDRGGR